MKIVDFDGDKIKACFTFVVGNCEISVSTIMNENRAEIAIFDKDSGDLLIDKLISIEDATLWANIHLEMDEQP